LLFLCAPAEHFPALVVRGWEGAGRSEKHTDQKGMNDNHRSCDNAANMRLKRSEYSGPRDNSPHPKNPQPKILMIDKILTTLPIIVQLTLLDYYLTYTGLAD
jgi:hypothetical protein